MGRIVEEVEADYFSKFPEERELVAPFLANFDLTWAKRRRAFGSELSVYFLRPENHMEMAFGFEREILAVYSRYDTLEPRTMQALEQFLSDDPAKGRVDTMTAFLISEAEDPSSWVRQYSLSNPESRLVAAFYANGMRGAKANNMYVRSVLASQLYPRDLFDYRLPLRNDAYFFGRDELIFDFYNAFKRSENRGLFGLRKTGKTSLIFKLERRLQAEGAGKMFYFDCKYPPLRQLRWGELLSRLAKDICRGLERADVIGTETPADTFIQAVALCPEDKQIALVFDEIEYISPFSSLDEHWKSDFVPFWQTIWACQSQHRNLSVFLAGVNPTVVEQDLVGGVQNPLFGIVPYHYLRGLRSEEMRRMVKTLGRRMGMHFAESAVEYLETRYGGHPLLTRIACSLTHKYLLENRETLPYEINADGLRSQEERRDAELSFYCGHVVSELRQFYPDEYQFLECIAAGQAADYFEFASEPAFTAHLRNYGLFTKDVSGRPMIAIPVVANYIGMEVARREQRRSILRVVEKPEREGWLKQRTESIDANLTLLRQSIDRIKSPPLFGALSYPESHKFFSLKVCSDENGFSEFINVCNRCFVEAIEIYGKSIGKSKYFWQEVVPAYPALGESLKRIKVYRHDRVHIRLEPQVDDELKRFLKLDLEGRKPSQVADLWFVLQQCTFDNLLVDILAEIDRIT